MLMIRAEYQLEEYYNKDSKTIIANCDTYVYMGGNYVATASEMSIPMQIRMLFGIFLHPFPEKWSVTLKMPILSEFISIIKGATHR